MVDIDKNIENLNITNTNKEKSFMYEKYNKSEQIIKILDLLGEKKYIKGKSKMGDLKIVKTDDKRIELFLTSGGSTIKFEATDPHFNESLLKMMLSSFVPQIDESTN